MQSNVKQIGGIVLAIVVLGSIAVAMLVPGAEVVSLPEVSL